MKNRRYLICSESGADAQLINDIILDCVERRTLGYLRATFKKPYRKATSRPNTCIYRIICSSET